MADNLKLGILPIEPVRDAVHVAVFPAVCDAALTPGDRVEITPDRDGQLVRVKWVSSGGDAVVDPFLSVSLPPGTAFYALLMPGTAVGLRHVYQHPKLRTVPPRAG
jgi:hypothetical protein